MLRSLKLVGVGPAPEMEMQFAPRLNVLTGDNGLGKSLFLETIWYVLTWNWAGIPVYPNGDLDGAKIEFEQDEHGIRDVSFLKARGTWEREIRDCDSLIIYARVDGSVVIWDPSRTFGDSAWGTGTIFKFSPEKIWRGIETQEGEIVCRGLIEDWVTWQEKRPETAGGRSFAHLAEILEMVSPNVEAGETIRPVPPLRLLNDARTFPAIDTGYGAVPIIHASAGMQRIINLAYLITWAWHEHFEQAHIRQEKPINKIVFLMDEVENHLHPEWQRRILPALLKVLESLGEGMQVQMHVTTHSPMVLASLEPHWDNKRDELFHFALKEGKVVLESTELGRRGTASRWLKSRIFGLHADRSIEAERAMEDANALMRGDEPKYFKTPEEIDKELERTLWDQDPFWARWATYMGKSKP
ncbi:MAG TPA: AAA family ATPase [Polyangium sp.]|nr:AAA family ATPase [Polyangium sp.]